MPKNEKYLLEAEGYIELELPAQALESLERLALEARQQHPFHFHFLAGEAHRQLKQYEQAIPHLQKARAERPAEIGTYINLGWCLKRTDRLLDAIEVLLDAERVCRQNNDESSLPLVLYNLACYFALRRDKEKMLSYLAEAIMRAPRYRDGVLDESDFDYYRNDPDLVRLISFVV